MGMNKVMLAGTVILAIGAIGLSAAFVFQQALGAGRLSAAPEDPEAAKDSQAEKPTPATGQKQQRRVVTEAPRGCMQLLESEPVTVHGVEFVALAQGRWAACNPPYGHDPIQVQLRITNRSDKDLLFPTFDTFVIVIKTAAGEEIRAPGIRSHVLRGAVPVLIVPGASYCLSRVAFITWGEDGKSRVFEYQDGTGSEFSYGPLHARKYTLSFEYENPVEEAGGRIQPKEIGGISAWSGKAVTKDVPFEVKDPDS